MSTEIPYHFAHLLQVLKKISLKSDYYRVFLCVFFHMYIAPARGRQPIGDKNFVTTERPFLFAHTLQKMIFSKSDFIHIFNDFIHVYSPGQGQKTPWGQTFDVNRKPLSL